MIDSTEVRNAISKNVRRLRKARGLTQEQFAAKVGISAVSVNRIEQGHSVPSAVILFAIADVLDVQADVLRQVTINAT